MTASTLPAADAATAAPSPLLAALAAQPASTPLTRVALAYVDQRIDIYLRFGTPAHIVRFDRWRRCAVFLPNAVFCRIRWQSNDYGTIRWQLMVMQTCAPLDGAQRIPGVQPGAHLLLHAEGENQVRDVLARLLYGFRVSVLFALALTAIGSQLALDLVARVHAVLLGQELHREVDAIEVAAGHGQVARLLGATGQQHGVKLFLQLFWRDGFLGQVGDLGALAQRVLGGAHHHTGAEDHPLGLHLQLTLRLLQHLNIGNTAVFRAHGIVRINRCIALVAA